MDLKRFSNSNIRTTTTDKRVDLYLLYVVISFICSTFLFAISSYAKGLDRCPIPSLFPKKIQFAILLVECLIIFLVLFTISILLITQHKDNETVRNAPLFISKRHFRITLIILVAWMPLLTTQYPAAMDWDTYNQLSQFFSESPTFYTTKWIFVDAKFIDHHPVFDTLIFGLFYSIGRWIGHENLGLFLYALVQSVLYAHAFATSIVYMSKIDAKKTLQIISIIIICIYPAFPLYATTMLKDSLFSVIFIYYYIIIVESWRTNGVLFRSTRYSILVACLTMLMCLTKKPGPIIVLLTLIALYIHLNKVRNKLLYWMITPYIIVTVITPLLVYPVMNIAPGGQQESFGPLIQQLVSTIKNGASVDDDQLEIISHCYDLNEALEKYDPELVDGTKNTYKQDATVHDRLSFLIVWMEMGLKHPISYLKATYRCSKGLFLPRLQLIDYKNTPMQSDWTINLFHEKEGVSFNYNKPEWALKSSNTLNEWLSDLFGMPTYDITLSKGFFVWMITHFILIAILFDKRSCIALMPVLVSLIILFVSPNSDFRYALPIVSVWHLVLALSQYCVRKELESSGKVFDFKYIIDRKTE